MIIETEKGCYLDVKVKTNQNAFYFYFKDEILYVHLKSLPKNNAANTELLKNLENILNTKVFIIKGHTNPKKRLFVPLTKKELIKKLSRES